MELDDELCEARVSELQNAIVQAKAAAGELTKESAALKRLQEEAEGHRAQADQQHDGGLVDLAASMEAEAAALQRKCVEARDQANAAREALGMASAPLARESELTRDLTGQIADARAHLQRLEHTPGDDTRWVAEVADATAEMEMLEALLVDAQRAAASPPPAPLTEADLAQLRGNDGKRRDALEQVQCEVAALEYAVECLAAMERGAAIPALPTEFASAAQPPPSQPRPAPPTTSVDDLFAAPTAPAQAAASGLGPTAPAAPPGGDVLSSLFA